LAGAPEELSGRSDLDEIHPDDHDTSRKVVAGPHSELRYPAAAQDRSIRWIASVAAPEGELIYASGLDVTEERRKEEALAIAEAAPRLQQSAHDHPLAGRFLRRRELPEDRRRR
jgi:hypothetical protein